MKTTQITRAGRMMAAAVLVAAGVWLAAPITTTHAGQTGDDVRVFPLIGDEQTDGVLSLPGTLPIVPATAPVPPIDLVPPSWIAAERSLIVDLSDFRIYAYENGALVRSSIIATGRFNMATQTGFYTVLRRALSADLTYRGNTVEAVPYILAYDDAFAIHGAYWHEDSAWGTRASSGCVNLPVDEAAWYYEFGQVGTPVIIRD